jgi:hypothetical protein
MARGKSQNPTTVEDQDEVVIFYAKYKGKSENLQKGFNALSMPF